jgi:hypothetical protein
MDIMAESSVIRQLKTILARRCAVLEIKAGI